MDRRFETNRRTFLSGATALGVFGGLAFGRSEAETRPKQLPDWEEGFLDIHHISTGRGDAAWIVCPDGTTMLIDAGDVGNLSRPPERLMPHRPNADNTPGQRIAGYIRRFSKPLKQPAPLLNHVFLTHFHRDHIGCREPDTPEAHGFALSGISMLAEEIPIEKIVDRAYPDYDFPSRKSVEKSNGGGFFADYLKFSRYQRDRRNTVFEGFVPGSRTQFSLKHAPEKYPDFRVRNIYVNGKIWTGEGTDAKSLFPEGTGFDENMCSDAIKLSYGDFHYFSGGDIPGFGKRDVETAVSEVVGPVSVLKLNHHGFMDSINPAFLAKLEPRVMVVPVWVDAHPHVQTFKRMTDRTIYPGDRSIYATGMFSGLENKLGEGARSIKPDGHVVIRVAPGGKRYDVFVLDSRTTGYDIIHTESLET